MKFIELLGFLFFLLISPCFCEDNCTRDIQTYNIQPNVKAENIFLIQHNCEQLLPILHALPNAHTSILNSPTFDKTKTMILYIPGWVYWTTGLIDKTNLIKTMKLNKLTVFEVNWGLYANSLNYRKAVVDMKKCAEFLGTTLAQLKANGVNSFHLIGHSLGAHFAGFTGKTFNSITSGKIDRITGLDPARSCFENELPVDRLNEFDANFVDIIHTDTKRGMPFSFGRVDFFPNGGNDMPGLLNIDHFMSIRYYTESIYNDNYVSVPCSSWSIFITGACKTEIPQVKMGFHVDTTTRGDYYLRTNGMIPYAMGTAGLS